MVKTDPRIDAYIQKSPEFARPVLEHLRKLIHTSCPDVEETIKWVFPHFIYNGEILCSFAAFKEHCAFTFWKADIMDDPDGILQKVGRTAMGNFGKVTALSELPADKILKKYIKEAARLNKEGIKSKAKSKPKTAKPVETPAYILDALKKNKKALKTFEGFNNTNRKEYVEWITEAKTEATQNKRLQTAIEWMAEGKVRNWRYIKK